MGDHRNFSDLRLWHHINFYLIFIKLKLFGSEPILRINKCYSEQVIAVPLLDGMLGSIIPARTWFGVLMSAIGVAVLECSGSPPNVRTVRFQYIYVYICMHVLDDVALDNVREQITLILKIPDWWSSELLECNIFWNSHAPNWTYFAKHREGELLGASWIWGEETTILLWTTSALHSSHVF